MNRKGYTLIEVIMGIAIMGLLLVAFLPLITFSYTNLIGSEKFTEAMLEDQSIVEKQINDFRFTQPNPSNYKEVFGVKVPVHLLSVNTTASGQVKLYLPEQTMIPRIPVIRFPPKLIAKRLTGSNIHPQPTIIQMFKNPYDSYNPFKLFVNEIDITDETKNEHLMNVYRWYTSGEMSSNEFASESTDDYIVIREWNEAKTIVPYSEALDKEFIPNMKEFIHPVTREKEQYNELNYKVLQNAYGYTKEQMINSFGNRYLKYGVTPFSHTGRMGKEELSNAIYIKAPRIEIESAKYWEEPEAPEEPEEPEDEKYIVIITFNLEIGDTFNPDLIILNEELGRPDIIKRDDEDHKKLILEFQQPIDKSKNINGNLLTKGSVISKDYGAISIWHNNYPSNEFTITP